MTIFGFSKLIPFFLIDLFWIMKFIYFLLLLVAVSCSGPEYHTNYYKAISLDTRDTAFLRIVASKSAFYGDYQVRYSDKSMDDGTITGTVKGDTLIGRFVYVARNNTNYIRPIALLKTNEKLKLGSGTAGTYMGFHVYLGGSVSFSDSLFQFYPIDVDEVVFLKNKLNTL